MVVVVVASGSTLGWEAQAGPRACREAEPKEQAALCRRAGLPPLSGDTCRRTGAGGTLQACAPSTAAVPSAHRLLTGLTTTTGFSTGFTTTTGLMTFDQGVGGWVGGGGEELGTVVS